MDELHVAQVPVATDAIAGPTSIVSNPEGFVTIADLLPDVRGLDSYSQFNWLIDLLILRLVISFSQRGAECGQCRLPSHPAASTDRCDKPRARTCQSSATIEGSPRGQRFSRARDFREVIRGAGTFICENDH